MNRKSRSLFSIVLLGLVCFVLPGALHADAFLTNADFSAGTFSGWTVTGTSPNFGVALPGTVITGTDFGTTTVIGYTGLTYAGYAVVCASGDCIPSGHVTSDQLNLSQQISVVAGDTYTTGFYVAANGGNGFGDSTNILVDGAPITLTSRPAVVGGAYELIEGTFTTADANPTITYVIDGSGSGDAGFSFDNFFVNGEAPAAAPEPSSLLLFGTGLLGLGLLARRRVLVA